MPKPSLPKLAVVLVALLTVAGVGYAGLIVWRDKVSIDTIDTKELAKEEKPTIEPPSPIEAAAPALDTSDWKTYRNEEFGFEVKYPSNFDVSASSLEGLVVTSPERYEVLVVVRTGYSSLEEYMNELDMVQATADEGDPSVEVRQRFDMRVAGYPAVQQEVWGLASGFPSIETFIDLIDFTPKSIILVSTQGMGEVGFSDALQQLHRQVISTFRIIDNP